MVRTLAVLLMGARNVLYIRCKVTPLKQRQRGTFGLNVRGKSIKDRKVPCADALNDPPAAVDLGFYAQALRTRLQIPEGLLPATRTSTRKTKDPTQAKRRSVCPTTAPRGLMPQEVP
jgi:hypothetical protein